MRDSVPSASYSSVCNVLRQWNIPLIPTYRVYRLYDMFRTDAQPWISCSTGCPVEQPDVQLINGTPINAGYARACLTKWLAVQRAFR